jgi:hypothetical protein
MLVETELKPCPFCGNDSKEEMELTKEHHDLSLGSIPGFDRWNVNCSCGSKGPDGYTREEAIVRWNKREAE